MRRIVVWILILWGAGCISLGLMVNTMSISAQDEAEYVGARECRSCHRDVARDHEETSHAFALQDVSRSKDPIIADFEQGENVRTVQFSGEDAPRAFMEDDVAYAIGAGRHTQMYLIEMDDQYFVLPAQWDSAAATWKPLQLAESWPDPAYDWTQNCAGCHTTGLNVERGRWEDDGVQCEACHGPGGAHVEAVDDAGRRPETEEIDAIHAAIVMSPDAQVCGQCHGRGTTTDGSYPYPLGYLPGTPLSDVFTLTDEADPVHWWETGHARHMNMQFNEWANSGHATSLETLKSSPAAQDECLQCHSGDYSFTQKILALYEDETLTGTPPETVSLQNAQYGVTCVTCHTPHDAEENDAEALYTQCTACHQNTPLMELPHHPVKEMFEGQTVIEAVEGIPSVHFSQEEGPRCVTCHMSDVPVTDSTRATHSWRPVLPDAATENPPNTCSECHVNLTTGDLQSLVEDTQAAVRSRLSIAWARVASIGTPEAGSEAETMYQQAVTALTFVQNDGSQGVHNYAYTDVLLDTASGLLAQVSVPGANLQPTEAPAPTATPSEPEPVFVSDETHATTGIRPMTVILIAAISVILLVGAFIIFRQES